MTLKKEIVVVISECDLILLLNVLRASCRLVNNMGGMSQKMRMELYEHVLNQQQHVLISGTEIAADSELTAEKKTEPDVLSWGRAVLQGNDP